MRVACLTTDGRGDPEVWTADLEPLYRSVAAVLPLGEGALNLEAACVVDGCVRWFQRGNGPTGVPSASVDVPLADLLAAVHAAVDPAELQPEGLRTYDLGHLDGVGLHVTAAVTLPDGHIVVAATAEDTPNAVNDGPINGSAVGLLDDRALLALEPLPSAIADWKVEGLALLEHALSTTRLLAVADQDDPLVQSPAIELTVRWSAAPIPGGARTRATHRVAGGRSGWSRSAVDGGRAASQRFHLDHVVRSGSDPARRGVVGWRVSGPTSHRTREAEPLRVPDG
jgi:hypothetical protein